MKIIFQKRQVDKLTIYILEPGKVRLYNVSLKSCEGFVKRIASGSLAKGDAEGR